MNLPNVMTVSACVAFRLPSTYSLFSPLFSYNASTFLDFVSIFLEFLNIILDLTFQISLHFLP